MVALLVSAVPLYKAASFTLDVPPSPVYQLAVLPLPSVPSLPPHLCSARGRDREHASHHGREQRPGGGFVPHDEPQAVLQDPGKQPTKDTLWGRTGHWCCRCATRRGSKEGLGIGGTGTEQKVSGETGERVITGGCGSCLKKCSECHWSPRLSAPTIFSIVCSGKKWNCTGN